MTEFIPPYPKRHQKLLNPLSLLRLARNDLLSVWSEDAFNFQFMGRKVFNQHVFIANHPDIVKYVFVDQNSNYERKSPMMRKALEALLGDGLFISDGETWANRRKIQTPLFTTQHVIRYSEIMVQVSNEMCATWEPQDGKNIHVLPEMAKLTAEIICRCLFGNQLGIEKATEVVSAFTAYQAAIEQMDLTTFLGLPSWFPLPGISPKKAEEAAQRIHAVVDDIINSSMEHDVEGSLLGLFLEAAKDDKYDPLTKIQIRNELIVLFMAGHETTANTLAWAWYLISQVPDVEQRIHAEINSVVGDQRLPCYDDYNNLVFTRAVLDETMRLYPPVPVLSRQSHREDVIRKRAIPPDSIMLVIPWLLHRHKQYWDKPDHFIPERFLPNAPRKINKYAYIPFSIGPRVCLGKYFGQIELVLSLTTLMQRFRLCLPQGTAVTHECRLTLRPKGGLPMRLEKR